MSDNLRSSERARRWYRQKLRHEFDFCNRVVDMVVAVIEAETKRPRGKGPKGVRNRTFNLSFALYTKLLKLARAVIAVCEIGLASEAEVLHRTLFETVLTLQFLLRFRVRLKGGPSVRRKPLTTYFRTCMYLACFDFQRLRHANELRKTKGTKRFVSKTTLAKVIQDAACHEKVLGTEWYEHLKTRPDYFGTSVRGLADSLGHLDLYQTYYRYASNHSHPGGLESHCMNDTDGRFMLKLDSALEDVRLPLLGMANRLLVVTQLFEKRYGLGKARELSALFAELKAFP